MEFYIQACQPRNSGDYSDTDLSVSDAIETVFPLNTENAFIVWKGFYIPLSYKYDFSIIIADVIKILQLMIVNDVGQIKNVWPSNTFQATWNLTWGAEDVRIDAQWNSLFGCSIESLNRAGSVVLKKSAFLAEWRMPLSKILVALTVSGYDKTKLTEMTNLEKLIDTLPKCSHLYAEG